MILYNQVCEMWIELNWDKTLSSSGRCNNDYKLP